MHYDPVLHNDKCNTQVEIMQHYTSVLQILTGNIQESRIITNCSQKARKNVHYSGLNTSNDSLDKDNIV